VYEATAGSQALDTLITRFEQVLLELKNLRKSGKAPQANAVTEAGEKTDGRQQS
jgi:hypothetical protein